MGDFFGGGSSKTTSEVKLPDWYEAILKDAAGEIGKYVKNPDIAIADRNKNQSNAGKGYRELVKYLGGTKGFEDGALDTVGQYMDAVNRAGNVERVTPERVTERDIAALANPYMEEQQRIGMERLNEGRQASQAGIGQRAAAAGAFGGSREAVERGALDKSYLQSVDAMRAQTAADAYGIGATLAQNNANAGNAASQYNANAANGANLAAASYLMQGVTADQNAWNLASGLANQYAGRMQSGLGSMYGYGNDLQGYNQTKADARSGYTAYQRLMPLMGTMPQSTTTTAPSNNGGWLGAAMTGLSFF